MPNSPLPRRLCTSEHRIGLLVLAVALLVGCNSVPTRDPEFRAIRPRAVPPPRPAAGALYQPGYELVLFEDIRARRIGDILHVRLDESTDASKNSETTLDKSHSTDIANPTIFGANPQFNLPSAVPLSSSSNLGLRTALSSKNAFSGDSKSTQSNSLKGTIAVTVAEVLPNGDLVVQGEKLFTLNQGSEHIRISGIVRSADIEPDDTVSSTRIANARVIYAGEGATADANVIGWLGRFFISALFPF